MPTIQNQNVTLDNLQGNAALVEYDSCTISVSHSYFMLNGSNNNLIKGFSESDISIHGGSGNTITGSKSSFTIKDTTVTIDGGSYNSFDGRFDENIGHTIQFNNGTGINSISTYGSALIYGAYTLSMSLDARESSLFIAGAGNETLDANYSTGAVQVYAWGSNSSPSNLKATTGNGDDLLFAGNGNATFAGGPGNNTFAFNKNNDAGGKTIISDFGASSGNKIWLSNYGFNQTDISNLLAKSQNVYQVGDDGKTHVYANLNLGNHDILIQDVSVSELHVNQFSV